MGVRLGYHLSCVVLWLASRLVPAHLRGAWLLEWHGELWHRAQERAATFGFGSGVESVLRATGAFRHALWLRRQHRAGRAGFLETLFHDVRYTVRRLRQSPGFVAVTVLIMGLGIGANTAIFSIVNAVLLRPMPYENPSELVRVFMTDINGTIAGAVSYPEFRDIRERTDLFVGAATSDVIIASLIGADGSEMTIGEYVSADFFDLLGLRPVLGRSFVPEEDIPGASELVAIISEKTWRARYGSDPEVVGQTMRLNGRVVTIVGVGPRGYGGAIVGINTDFWVPIGTAAILDANIGERIERRSSRSMSLHARLRPGVTFSRASSALAAMRDAFESRFPDDYRGRNVVVMPSVDVRLHPFVDRALVPIGGFLMVVAGMVLVVAVTNLANLLLVRASTRSKEIAVRLALGARRSRLVMQLLVESLVLGVLGGAAGLAFAYATAELIVSARPPTPFPIAIDLGWDARVLAFAFLLSLVTGLVFGLVPALRASRPNLVPALKDESTGLSGVGRRRLNLRNVLVVAQVAVSLVLLLAAGLFIRGIANAHRVDPGFETERIALGTVDPSLAGLSEEETRAFYDVLRRRLLNEAGVVDVALVDRAPLDIGFQTRHLTIPGVEPPAGVAALESDFAIVTPGYFDVMDIPILQGRAFEAGDAAGGPRVVIVSAHLARTYWGDENVVGERFYLGRDATAPPVEIVGVAADTKVRTLGEGVRPFLYTPFAQDYNSLMTAVVRTTVDPAPIPEAFRQTVAALLPDAPVFQAKTMAEQLGATLFASRIGAVVLSCFGALALVLASIGLYGIVAFSVAQRTREVGIRVALGADRGRVTQMVVREGLGLVAVGVVIGAGAGLALARPMAEIVRVPAFDALTTVTVMLIPLVVAALASYVPGRRAARVDPMTALRSS